MVRHGNRKLHGDDHQNVLCLLFLPSFFRLLTFGSKREEPEEQKGWNDTEQGTTIPLTDNGKMVPLGGMWVSWSWTKRLQQ
jgi:hypothetical protein